ncbi:MAG: hypothetical protein NT005_02010 [Spirochaetes bacterium]|nr:hypothetical protein [Spirochaetota bacterium]
MKLSRVFLVLGVCAAVVLASCASAPPVAAPAAAPAEKPAAAPAEKPAAAPAVSKDYLGDDTKLFGTVTFPGEGADLYTVWFNTAEVLTPPSPATKNEALVKVTGSETQFWTPYIASSCPATKEELKPGMLVFAVWEGGTQPLSRDALAKTTTWSLWRVKDVSNLYKGTVTLEYHSTYGSSHWKEREYHPDNIRVIVGEFSPELAK